MPTAHYLRIQKTRKYTERAARSAYVLVDEAALGMLFYRLLNRTGPKYKTHYLLRITLVP